MTLRRLLIAALAAPLLSACVDTTNQKVGGRIPPGGAQFRTYVALGTSIGAGIQSGGINDSTQRQAYPVLLARAMGLTVGASFAYPSFAMPGCPPPYTNPTTGARVTPAGYPTSTGTSCYTRNPVFIAPFMNNLGIPSIRADQVLNIDLVTFPATDTLKLSQFVTGGKNPISVMTQAQPTFVTLEIGANDVLGAATRGDSTLLTPLANFQTSFTAIGDAIAATGANVAVTNVPNVTVIPHFSLGVIFYCLKNGGAACPAPLPTATLPYSLATFTVDASCLPSAALPGVAVGDSMLVTFPATAQITGVLAAGGAASLNCGTGVATVTTAAGTGPAGATIPKATMKAITARVTALNTFIQAQATTRGWAFVDLNGGLAAARAAGQIPGFPDFTKPTTTLFGPVFSLDGIHPNAAGHKIIAGLFVAAINTKYSSTLTPP